MFAPSQEDVRRFFCQCYLKWRDQLPMTPLEALACDWISSHPEYHRDLSDEQSAIDRVYEVSEGRENPFLHLSMHLSIAEQISIDQPRGIKQAYELLSAKLGSSHSAYHVIMDCLGEMIWASQRSGLPPDGLAYLEAIRRRATQ